VAFAAQHKEMERLKNEIRNPQRSRCSSGGL
jgi:hypothetical protein